LDLKLKELVKDWEPAAKVGGWLYLIGGIVVGAAAWVTTLQLAVASNSSAIKDLREQVRPIDLIRQDVRWIKKRLGGPDN
jgi:hypothetical protein